MISDKIIKRIIKLDKPEFKDCPYTIEGKILIKRLVMEDGNFLGFIVADIDDFSKILSLDDITGTGWEEIIRELK
ncbi:MAG: hypothetical protein QXG12_06480 [Thermoproteota archaeon]